MEKNQGAMKQACAFLFCCLVCLSCESARKVRPGQDPTRGDLSVYRVTNDQAGHEYVKTEEFLVPVGAVVAIQALDFDPGSSALTHMHQRILQQVFNSLEEITENTVGDTNRLRVAEFKNLQFEIRGYPDASGRREEQLALAEARAKAVMRLLTDLGTPSWRLTATGLGGKSGRAARAGMGNNRWRGRVEFIRIR